MVLMPIISPLELRRGPPELPGLMAASVWIMSRMMVVFVLIGPAEGRDDAVGQGAVEAEGIADGQDLLPDLEPGRIAEGDGLQGLAPEGGRRDEGQVVFRVGALDLALDVGSRRRRRCRPCRRSRSRGCW